MKDGRILKLVHYMLKGQVALPDGTRTATTEGGPQGGPLSRLLSNVVLDELDWELARRGIQFVCCADDFSVFVKNKPAGRRVMDPVRKFIDRCLRLLVKKDHSSVTGPNHQTFLGYQFRSCSLGWRCRLDWFSSDLQHPLLPKGCRRA